VDTGLDRPVLVPEVLQDEVAGRTVRRAVDVTGGGIDLELAVPDADALRVGAHDVPAAVVETRAVELVVRADDGRLVRGDGEVVERGVNRRLRPATALERDQADLRVVDPGERLGLGHLREGLAVRAVGRVEARTVTRETHPDGRRV